jgi:hypothetical protein
MGISEVSRIIRIDIHGQPSELVHPISDAASNAAEHDDNKVRPGTRRALGEMARLVRNRFELHDLAVRDAAHPRGSP